MTRVLAVDVGKSRCRATLVVDGVRVGSTERPSPAVLSDPDGPAALAAVVSTLRVELTTGLAGEPIDVLAGGVAGLHRYRPAAQDLLDRLSASLDAAVVLASDMTTSHLGALGGDAGVVVAAGTGAVALGVDAGGGTRVVDGWGYLLGDAGSGWAIGRAGLDAALRAHDGRGGSPALADLAGQRYGDLDDLPQTVREADNAPLAVAAFARDVLAAAEAGDPVAGRVWRDAGSELARTTAAAAPDGVDRVGVSTVGGLFDAGAALVEPFTAELSRLLPAADLRPPVGDALDGAHRLALSADLPHEGQVHRRPHPSRTGAPR